MKSNKQRRLEIKAKRLKRAKKLLKLDITHKFKEFPQDVILANHEELKHNNTCGLFPEYYVDILYTCCDCGSEEIWTAKQQKWWYEIAKGNIDSRAIRCYGCRKKIRYVKNQQKKHMEEMATKKIHPNEAFFKGSPRRSLP
ncbi:MAG: zinc-ribbon domain containing protein [Candidatus Marithrix sp.]|nr:zinc-ribbon domain containing protein [Candidatus Marithrix sp.]